MTKIHIQTHSTGTKRPDPEVVALPPQRRIYTSTYKLRILLEAEAIASKGEGGLGAFLRKEGLYSSHLSQWRRQKAQGLLGERKRGKDGKARDALVKEILQLKRRLAASEKRAAQAEFLVDLQKKISQLMGPSFNSEIEEV